MRCFAEEVNLFMLLISLAACVQTDHYTLIIDNNNNKKSKMHLE